MLDVIDHLVFQKYHWTLDYWDSLLTPIRRTYISMLIKDAELQADALEDAKSGH